MLDSIISILELQIKSTESYMKKDLADVNAYTKFLDKFTTQEARNRFGFITNSNFHGFDIFAGVTKISPDSTKKHPHFIEDPTNVPASPSSIKDRLKTFYSIFKEIKQALLNLFMDIKKYRTNYYNETGVQAPFCFSLSVHNIYDVDADLSKSLFDSKYSLYLLASNHPQHIIQSNALKEMAFQTFNSIANWYYPTNSTPSLIPKKPIKKNMPKITPPSDLTPQSRLYKQSSNSFACISKVMSSCNLLFQHFHTFLFPNYKPNFLKPELCTIFSLDEEIDAAISRAYPAFLQLQFKRDSNQDVSTDDDFDTKTKKKTKKPVESIDLSMEVDTPNIKHEIMPKLEDHDTPIDFTKTFVPCSFLEDLEEEIILNPLVDNF